MQKFTIMILALTLCSSSFASTFSDCYKEFKPSDATFEHNVIRACAQAGDGFLSCYAEAQKHFLNKGSAAQVCKSANAGFSDCFEVAEGKFHYKTVAIKVCANFKEE